MDNAPLCEVGKFEQIPHPAEIAYGDKYYLYLNHDGSSKWTCGRHSGVCHPACWPQRIYPDVYARIAPGNLPVAAPERDGTAPSSGPEG